MKNKICEFIEKNASFGKHYATMQITDDCEFDELEVLDEFVNHNWEFICTSSDGFYYFKAIKFFTKL